MADYKVTDTELISVANAIRLKCGTSSALEWPTGFSTAIQNIPSGGTCNYFSSAFVLIERVRPTVIVGGID